DDIRCAHALTVEWRWLRWEPLRRGGLLAGYIGLRNRPLLDGPDWIPVGTIEDEGKRHLRELNNGLDSAPAHRNVGKNRSARRIVIPDIVVNDLLMPDPFAGLDIQCDKR